MHTGQNWVFNVDFVQEEIKDLRNLVTQKIRESQINNSGQKRDAFRYLMEDTDESWSENNIEVLGIVDFPNSPHQINKKAYQLKLLFEKSSPFQYRSRLGFNLYKLPVGYYTMVVEWFPPEMNEISVTAQGTTISISDETTKTFEKYTKTVIHFHRWGSSPPQFIYLDLHGTVSKQSLLTIGHLERFSNECRKTKTKAITLTNHNRNKTQNEPIRNQIKYKQLALSAGKRVRASHDWFWFYA